MLLTGNVSYWQYGPPFRSGAALDVSYRMYHKNGSLIWIHLNGRRMSPEAETMRFYAVFTGISRLETRLFQNIANETADGIYVIDKNNYDLLYVNESKGLNDEHADLVQEANVTQCCTERIRPVRFVLSKAMRLTELSTR